MKTLFAVLSISLLAGVSAHAFTCEKGTDYISFRLFPNSIQCRSTYEAVKGGQLYCITELSNIAQIETLLEGNNYRDVEACIDEDSNVVKLNPLD